MRLLSIIIPFLFSGQICNGQDNTDLSNHTDLFNIDFDSISIDFEKFGIIEGSTIEAVCQWGNQYILDLGTTFMSLSNSLTQIKQFPMPSYIVPDADVFVRDDTLMVSSSDGDYDFTEYYNPQEREWLIKDKAERDPIHRLELNCEDNNYKILYSDGGGCYKNQLVFWDKKNRSRYQYHLKMKRLINFKNEYYVIGNNLIYRIKDPSSCNQEQMIPYIKTQDLSLISGMLLSKQLYILANDEKETIILKLTDNKFEKVFSLGQRLNFHSSRKYNHISNQKEDTIILPFNCSGKSGFLEIERTHIHIIILNEVQR